MKYIKQSIVRQIFGFILIIIGLVGLALPVLPGWLLIFIGLELIGFQLVFFDKIKAYVKEKIDKGKRGNK